MSNYHFPTPSYGTLTWTDGTTSRPIRYKKPFPGEIVNYLNGVLRKKCDRYLRPSYIKTIAYERTLSTDFDFALAQRYREAYWSMQRGEIASKEFCDILIDTSPKGC